MAGSAVAPAPAAPAARRWPGLREVRGVVGGGSTPAKLRVWLAVLVAVSLLWGGVAAWTVAGHASAAGSVVAVSEPLSVDAQQVYRLLSDADATAAAEFLAGGLDPLRLRARYQADIAQAARRVEAATAAGGQSAAGPRLAALSAGIPVYAGLVETARADNLMGLPVGAAFLRQASGLMRATLLPAAAGLYRQENAQLADGDRGATGLPWAAFAAALIAALLLYGSQRWLWRRTHRRVNYGLLAASLAGLVALAWLASGLWVARGHLDAAREHGSAPVGALARADIAMLQARADESLTLIDRSGDDSFQQDFLSEQKRLGPGRGTLLTAAAEAAQGSAGAPQAAAVVRAAPAWFTTHQQIRSLDNSGNYAAGVQRAIGTGPADSATPFGRLDAYLTSAIAADQASFRSAARAGQGALTGLEAGMIALALVMAGGCAWGISRRLAEYR